MIDLSGATPLTESRNHTIFDHPTHGDILIKVRAHLSPKRTALRRYGEWRYGQLRQWHREANEYLAAMSRGSPEIARLSRFMGFARTTEGPAMLVEKLTAPDGRLAQNLADEVRQTAAAGQSLNGIVAEAMELMDDLERGRIIVGDLHLKNIVRPVERDGRLTVIDGLGERVLLPFSVVSRTVFHASVERRRAKLRRIILRRAVDGTDSDGA